MKAWMNALCCFLGMVCASSSFAQDTLPPLANTSCVLWRGFQQSWGYNHRLNRIGDYVDNYPIENNCLNVDLVHTAATGLGMDTCHIQSYFTYLQASNISTVAGEASFKLEGFKGVPIKVSEEVRIVVPPDFDPNTVVQVFINGFDIYSTSPAQKLQALSLKVSEALFLPDSRELAFTLSAEATLDCRSLECPKFNPVVDYQLHVNYLLVAGKELLATEKRYTQAFLWDKKTELEPEPENDTIQGVGNQQYQAAVVGFQEFVLLLDNEHWMLDWRSFLDPVEYSAATGQYILQRNLLFKQWAEKMRKSSEKKYESVFAERRPGAAVFSGKLLMLQVKQGCTQNDTMEGSIRWMGKNLTPDQPRAVLLKSYCFKPDACD
ncbi:MAG: hypothetical protein SFW35_08060 [Chitinophagales bacterium]|nr:hypothetical protein [Chitinophagales bacterium]